LAPLERPALRARKSGGRDVADPVQELAMTLRPSEESLKRLLGAAAPELLCDECFQRIARYVQLELDGSAADEAIPGMRAHLDGCPACHEEYESLRELVRASAGRA
jgi:hypothetical protein